jgi:hypothetical protein
VPAGGQVWIPLPAGVFTYNGTDNLVMQIEVTDNSAATGTVPWRINTGFPRNVKLGGDLGAATGTVIDYYHYATFRFNGGTMNVIEPNVTGYDVPFSTNVILTFMQALYGGHALGTGGPVNKVSLRLSADNAADVTFTGAVITLGHTTLTNLTTTPASNIDNPTQVFSGNITIPGGLKAGDWVDIPVSGFTYDPRNNLILQILAGSGPSSVSLLYGGSGIVSNSGRSAPGAGTLVLEGSRHPHVKFGLSK